MDLARTQNLLPETVRQMADVIGIRATQDLVAALGGARFKFGKGREDTARLRLLFSAIGEAKTYELLKVFGGEELYIPRCDAALRGLRNEQFRNDFIRLKEKGMSGMMAMTELCPRYGISDRTGYTILRDLFEPVTQQGALF